VRLVVREHQVAVDQDVVGDRGAGPADLVEERLQRHAERVVVAAVDGLAQRVVETVELVEVGVVDLELALTHDADDHS
jgi:hypothetical protein